MRHDPNYRLLRAIENLKQFNIYSMRTCYENPIVKTIVIDQVAVAMKKSDRKFVELALGI